MQMRIDWDSFKAYIQDSRGVRFKFEDLCRQLFVNENIAGNKQFRYLHANPNNHGLETEPIYDETNKQWIGFQAKFFEDAVDYDQIKHSAEETIKYYTGEEGKVDLVFIFCNRPITSTAKGYVDTVNLLKSYNIKIQLITDNAILDLVRNKYHSLALYYFGNHNLEQDWFIAHTNYMFDELGVRYNRNFNVETEFLTELSLFVHDQKAVAYLNGKKSLLIDEIESLYNLRERDIQYLGTLKEATEALPDVTIETLYSAEEWAFIVKTSVNSFINAYIEEYNKQKEKRNEYQQFAYDASKTKDEQEAARKRYQSIDIQLMDLKRLLDLPEILAISDRESQLLHGDILFLKGRAGTGKSQLLATKTKSLLDENRLTLLLVAGIYFTSDPIQKQIMENLSQDYSFDDLIDILESIGEKNNYIIPVFIDAINETWNRRLWKVGLSPIVEKITSSPMVRLVVSYRTEYEEICLPDSIWNSGLKDNIAIIEHNGFEDNSTIAVKEFMDYYSIPFTPLEFFSQEMSNPLFLTLYCKTYDGEDVSLTELYERIIEQANKTIFRALESELRTKGYTEDDDLVGPLITQIADSMVTNDNRFIAKENLMQLNYWTEYGLTAAVFIKQLIKENILYDSVFEEKETYFFAYDQMNDYYCAKAIIQKCKTKDKIRTYLSDIVLEINDENIGNYWNVDLFVNACALYAERFGEECIDIIDRLKDEGEQWQVFSKYIDSFQWRESKYIPMEEFYNFLTKYPCTPDNLWPMLIGNSIKINHPLNADFLHSFLSRYALNRRDSLWTVYINKLTMNESDRIVQLIQMYDRGEKLETKSEKQVELLLTLFAWLLTSSNRWLRDYSSKAMIEILKEHFQLCQTILEKFKDINDPYVIQRLYGVVFGACCKNGSVSFQSLAEYVYETIFNQEKVYADILLRDYARLIIERFLVGNPDYKGTIQRDKIVPPYNSDPIPELEDQEYLKKEYDGAMRQLIHSMRFEGMGMYGDFGRYVFQSALHNFDVDDKKMFNYAVYYILTNLGFNDDYFRDHDTHYNYYDRGTTKKIERIGKKYQWITMYNMLARISDHCKMIDRWNYLKNEEIVFEGAWEPYVRDFDPTLNQSFMACKEAPIFKELKIHAQKSSIENKTSDVSTPDAKKTWLKKAGFFFENLKNTLILSDENEQQWICLTSYCDTGRKNLDVIKLCVWSFLYAYFVTPEQAEAISSCVEKGLSIISTNIASHHQTYTIFNREYPWSPSCKEFDKYAWVDIELKTGEVETVVETEPAFDYSSIEEIIRKYDYEINDEANDESALPDEHEKNNGDTDEGLTGVQYRKVIRQHEITKKNGSILHATTDLLWEEVYDATIESAISYSFPCAKFIEEMELTQLSSDGFLYDKDGKLAAFDTNLTQKMRRVVVRKDILDSFLEKTGMQLVWLVDAEKEIHADDHTIASWSDWEGMYIYKNGEISGDICWLHNNGER